MQRRQEISIRTEVIRGIGWTGTGQSLAHLCNFIGIIVLSKFLEPRDFGIIAIANFLFGLIGLIRDFNLGSAVIQKQEKVNEAANFLFWASSGLGLFYFALVFFLSKYIAIFYNENLLDAVLKALSIILFLGALSNVQMVLYRRRLEFRLLNIVLISSFVLKLVVSVCLAILGWGVWALVGGLLCQSLFYLVYLWLTCEWRPSFKFDLTVGRGLIGFGKDMTLFSIMTYIILSGDAAFLGKVLGAGMLGYYYLAFGLANFFALFIVGISQDVLFPAFARLQKDISRLKEAFYNCLRYVALVTLPVNMGIFILSKEITLVLYGERWLPLVTTLRVLCGFGLFRSFLGFGNNIFLAKGEINILLKLALRHLLVLSLIIYPLSIRFGIFGTALAVTIAMACNGFWFLKRIKQSIGVEIRPMLDIMRVSIVASFGMGVLLYFFKICFPFTELVPLIIFIIGGIIFYLCIIFILDRRLIQELWSMTKDFLIRRQK